MDEARTDRVGAHFLRAVLEGRVPGEPEQAVLGGDVGGGRRKADASENGCHVDDGSATVLRHRWQLHLEAVEDGVEVDLDHPAPAFERIVADEILLATDARVVDRDAQRRERVGLVDTGDRELGVGYITDDHRGGAACRADLVNDGLQRLGGEVGQDDGCSVRRELEGYGASDARARPGHNRRAVCHVVTCHGLLQVWFAH